MSYTDGVIPDDLMFSFDAGYWAVMVTFTCPRCGEHVKAFIKLTDLRDFEVECTNPACRLPGERYGYQLTAYMQLDGACLGESDRPLHTRDEINTWWEARNL